MFSLISSRNVGEYAIIGFPSVCVEFGMQARKSSGHLALINLQTSKIPGKLHTSAILNRTDSIPAMTPEQRAKKLEQARQWHAANPEKSKANSRRYYAANREKAFEASQKWQSENPEKVKESRRKWYQANKEKVAERNRKLRAENPQKAREPARRWKEANGGKAREASRN